MFDSRSRPHHGSFLADSKSGRQRRDGSPGAVDFRSLKPKERGLKSPGGGGLKSLAGRGQLPRLASRAQKISMLDRLIFQSEIKAFQTQTQPSLQAVLCPLWISRTRQPCGIGRLTPSRGVGGLTSALRPPSKPPWLYSEIFFSVAIFCSFDRLRVGPILQPGRWKGESRQRFETPSDQFARAQRCWSADLFSTALKDRRSHAENCREIRGGGYGR